MIHHLGFQDELTIASVLLLPIPTGALFVVARAALANQTSGYNQLVAASFVGQSILCVCVLLAITLEMTVDREVGLYLLVQLLFLSVASIAFLRLLMTSFEEE